MARTHPTQLLADVVAELRGVNERLDTLLARLAPQAAPVLAEPTTAEPERVRLEEPSRPHPSEQVAAEMAAQVDEGIDVETDAQVSPIDQHGTCQEQTKRGNVCGKPLPCRYHG